MDHIFIWYETTKYNPAGSNCVIPLPLKNCFDLSGSIQLGGVYSSLCAICRRYIAEAPGAAPPPSPPPPPTLISSDPRSPARCLAHRMSPRRPRPAASPPPPTTRLRRRASLPPPPSSKAAGGHRTRQPGTPKGPNPGRSSPGKMNRELPSSATAPLLPARAMNSFPRQK